MNNNEDIKSDSTTESTNAVDSEIIEAPFVEDLSEAKEPVIIKKGSFLSVLAFLLSASALTVSAYLYIQAQEDQTNNTDNTWQAPLAAIEESSNQKLSLLSKQVSSLQKTNTALQNKLKNIEKASKNPQPVYNSGSDVEERHKKHDKYDDAQIIGQLKELEAQLSAHELSLAQIQSKTSNSNEQYNQTFQQLRNDINNNKKLSLSVTKTVQPFKSNYAFETVLSLLQEANIQLNIRGNIKKSLALLSKAKTKMVKMPDPKFTKLAEELQAIIINISDIKPPEPLVINSQIDGLSIATKQLSFTFDTNTNDDRKPRDSSWYDKLIVIRKIDDNQQVKLTNSEQQIIRSKLKNHYGLLKIALVNNDQTAWGNEIIAIETLLNLHFADASTNIKLKLAELKVININPELPDLANYLNRFKSSNGVELTEETSDYPDSD